MSILPQPLERRALFAAAVGTFEAGPAHSVAAGPVRPGIVVAAAASTTLVQGYVFTDADRDRIRDVGEAGVAGRTVFADTNSNGMLDPAEPSGLTDATGLYRLALPDGTYTLFQVLPIDSMQTGRSTAYAGAATVTNDVFSVHGVVVVNAANPPTGRFDFGTLGTGTVRFSAFLDANANGRRDTGEPLDSSANFVWADFDGDGIHDAADEPGTYAPSEAMRLPAGTYPMRIVPKDKALSAQAVTVTLTAGKTVEVAFALTPAGPRYFTVTGSVFIDTNRNGKRDGQEGEQGELGGWYAFVDTNNSGGLDDADLYAAATSYGAYNRYTLILPADGRVYRVLLRNDDAGVRGFTTPWYYDLRSLAPGLTVADQDFGLTPIAAGAAVRGSVFNDANKNAKRDTAEAGLSGVVVYVDLDNDKVRDPAEQWMTTDAAGDYAFNDLPDTGTATRVRVVLPAGGTQTSPANGYGHALTLTAGATNTGKSFGVYVPPPVTAAGTISGYAFNDTNKNGTKDAGETFAAGKTVWLDLDDDNIKDPGEATRVTGADGSFVFTGLAARTYHVRREFPTGYAESTPARYVTLKAGQTVGGVTLGSRTK